ncbi:MAG: hypothetical protein I8H71_01250 [Xanthomonadaceae bacterium]|nr:hypothetical protein [Xanthomonadaceae bacterium]
MSNVIPFGKREQHGQGEAFCIGCSHTWQAVAPTGAVALECPACGTHKGHWKFEFYPSAGEMVRECGCGNQLFYLTPRGHLCANCGVYQEY